VTKPRRKRGEGPDGEYIVLDPGPPIPKRRYHAPKDRVKADALVENRQNFLAKFKVHRPKRKATGEVAKRVADLRDFLRETHARWVEKFDGWSKFTDRQIAFARYYAKNGRSNLWDALRRAGYATESPGACRILARGNLAKEGMEELIQAFEIEEKARMTITVEEVVEQFKKFANAAFEAGDFANANRAMENLGKYLQMFVEKREITVRQVRSREELDAEIARYQKILDDNKAGLEERIRLN
jgi:hypothetical protein